MDEPIKIAPEFVSKLLSGEREEPATALAQLSQFWGVRATIGENGDLVGLSRPERNVSLMLVYTGEVGNGGHVQFFLNPSGALAHETVDALTEIEAHESAAILRDAIDLFPNSRVPKDEFERDRVIQDFQAKELDRLNSADQAAWLLRVDELALAYLRKHRDQVLTPEQRD